ncbi:MAG TPA: SRPBCC domain-containing protein [Gemmatimonadaceae bacterium]|nr:SRPBCC domain-containing protein [Gemmatimonadaceae bacterium]
MTTAATNSLRVSQTIRASRERLFRAWTEPEQLMQWWRMEGDGWAFADASLDLRVGGAYRLGMTDPDGKTHTAVGIYREVDPPERLSFTWDWEDEAHRVGETLVTVEFHSTTDTMTEVILTHERFADAARVDGHERGWMQLLRLLDHMTQDTST